MLVDKQTVTKRFVAFFHDSARILEKKQANDEEEADLAGVSR